VDGIGIRGGAAIERLDIFDGVAPAHLGAFADDVDERGVRGVFGGVVDAERRLLIRDDRTDVGGARRVALSFDG